VQSASGAGSGRDLWAALPILGIVLLVGTVAVLFYFFFSVEHKRRPAGLPDRHLVPHVRSSRSVHGHGRMSS
jgi:hypothetical protein